MLRFYVVVVGAESEDAEMGDDIPIELSVS